jgi:RNA recognition motif-containing protein
MANEEAKLFVAGLPDSVSEDVLKQLFEATGGKVVSVSLPKDRITGRPRGFGFVTLATPQEAQAARDALDGSMQAGKSISVRPFQAEPPRRDALGGPGAPRGALGAPGGGPPGPRGGPAAQAPDRTLYIGNLPYDATVEEVQGLINTAVPDSVVRVHLPMDADGRKRGFGFVTMASAEAAKSAETALRSADLRARRLVVNLAHPKGERPARPEGGGGGGGGGSFQPSFTPSFGGGASSGPQHRKLAPHEERRKRSFEDGGGPKKKGRAERGGGGAGKVVDYGDDDEK